MLTVRGRSISVWRLVLSLAVCLVLGDIAFGIVIRMPEAKGVLPQLRQEWAAIQPPTGARLSNYSAESTEAGIAMVEANIAVASDYQAVRRYYDAEMARNGWQFCGEERVIGGGQDLGGIDVAYRKASFQASLQYAGDRANYGWTYSLSLSYGLSNKCR